MHLTAWAQEVAPQCRGNELQPQKQQSHMRADESHCLILELFWVPISWSTTSRSKNIKSQVKKTKRRWWKRNWSSSCNRTSQAMLNVYNGVQSASRWQMNIWKPKESTNHTIANGNLQVNSFWVSHYPITISSLRSSLWEDKETQ